MLCSQQGANAEIYSSISGKVIAEDTGQGISGVTVLARPERRKEQYRTITDANGLYVIKGVRAGTYRVHFLKDKSPYLEEGVPTHIVVPLGKNVVNVNYVLKLGGSVSGTVYAADGVTPMSNVHVSVYFVDPQPSWDGSGLMVTDSNGKYIISGLPESTNCIVSAFISGHADNFSRTIAIKKGKTTENVNFTIKLDDITGITGYVRSSIDNKPIKEVDIYMMQQIILLAEQRPMRPENTR